MGNVQGGGGGSKTTTQVVLKVKHEKIIVHHAYKMTLEIASLETFPHGLDGLRLWEAGIVLARYVVAHSALFKGKRVLELGAGVGIAGMAARKWTECRDVEMTDYSPQVLENIKRNMERNAAICPVFPLDWKKHGAHTTQYDIIMGSDIVYFGCPVEDLYQVFKENLAYRGVGLIVIPVRKNYAELFAKQVEAAVFELEVERLERAQFFESPLEDEAAGRAVYPLLRELSFEVYRLTKKL